MIVFLFWRFRHLAPNTAIQRRPVATIDFEHYIGEAGKLSPQMLREWNIRLTGTAISLSSSTLFSQSDNRINDGHRHGAAALSIRIGYVRDGNAF